MTLKAVLFDMDGVLCATVEYHYRSWKTVTDEYGIPFTFQDNEKLLGLTRRRSLEVILDGRDFSEEEKEKMLRRKNEQFSTFITQMGPGDLLPGVLNLLQEIRASGVRMAVASASRNTAPILRQLGIVSYMDVICDGNLIKNSKPAPDVFLQAAAALGVVPGSCLVVEDSRPGIQAALGAGMCAIGLGPISRVGLAHAVFSSLSGVNFRTLQDVYGLWNAAQRPDKPANMWMID